MTPRHVSILCLDDAQKRVVETILLPGPVESNGDYLMGEVDAAGIARLDEGGLLYTLDPAAPPAPAADLWAGGAAARHPDPSKSGDASSGRIVLDLAGALGPSLAQALAEAGATLRERIGAASYIAAYSGDLAALRALPLVREARWHGETATLHALDLVEIARTAPVPLPGALRRDVGRPSFDLRPPGGAAPDRDLEWTIQPADATIAFDVRCHDAAELDGCAGAIAALPGVHHVDKGRTRIRFWAPTAAAADVQNRVAALPQTAVVEPYVPPEALLDYARSTLWGAAPPAASAAWTGAGETIAVADTGIDLDHPDFGPRVALIGPTDLPPDRDPGGHGTHVASIIAGDGSASGGRLAGVAPAARLVVQRLGERLEAMPLEIVSLHEAAYAADARIHNLSWGSEVKSHYVLNSDDLDSFVAAHPDFLIVVAAGNWGVQDVGTPGFPIGLSSLGAPANAKNCLTVGACCSPRSDGPYAGLDWAEYDGANPPLQPPMAALPLTGDDAIVAANSSRGPSDDNRIKPDLVAVGVGVAAARSADRGAPIKPWGNDDKYMYLTGTSMAEPLVSGAAALVRQYLREKSGHRPSAALMKAILINAARWLPGSQQEDGGQPNVHQGFGRLDLSRAFPADDKAGFALAFVDIADSDSGALQMEKVGGIPAVDWRRRLAVAAGSPLSVTLCWTDPPGRWLQHDLDLVVLSPDGEAIAGNALLARMPGQKSDRSNNVERIVVDSPAAGEWVVMVKPFNTFRHAQGFGLAVTGAIGDWIA